MNGDPCYGCELREVGCHSKCDKYIAWKKAMDDLKEIYKEVTKKEAMVHSYFKDSNERNAKKKHLKCHTK